MTMPMMMFNESHVVPEYSLYSGATEYDTQPFRIEEGRFAGTIFIYSEIRLDECDDGELLYTVTVLKLDVDGKQHAAIDQATTEEFHEKCCKPILIEIISNNELNKVVMHED